MDVIEKFINDHSEVKEEIDILEKIVNLLNSDAFSWNNVFKISSFFDKEVKEHFRLEEQVLFPVMKKVLPSDKQKILAEIEKEHRPILSKLDAFRKIAEKHSEFLARNTQENFIRISHEIIESIIPHAKKEDEQLFPLAKIYFKPDNWKQLEEMYFKYLKV